MWDDYHTLASPGQQNPVRILQVELAVRQVYMHPT